MNHATPCRWWWPWHLSSQPTIQSMVKSSKSPWPFHQKSIQFYYSTLKRQQSLHAQAKWSILYHVTGSSGNVKIWSLLTTKHRIRSDCFFQQSVMSNRLNMSFLLRCRCHSSLIIPHTTSWTNVAAASKLKKNCTSRVLSFSRHQSVRTFPKNHVFQNNKSSLYRSYNNVSHPSPAPPKKQDGKHNKTIEKQKIQDVSSIKHSDFPLPYYFPGR